MTQFNLLPDIKLEYIKSKRTQDLVILVSVILIAAFLAIFIILYVYVGIIQKHHLSSLSDKITSNTQQISSSSNLDKVLTIQNQLESLPALYQARPATTELLPFINQLTPASATISSLNINFTGATEDTGSIQGNADSLSTVNTFVDTLKFTNYTISGSKSSNAFSNVVLSAFAVTTTPVGVSYTISFSFDPLIFNQTTPATLSVPDIITTRSITQQPTDLFLGTSSESH